jgi:hypothetical protein
MPGGAKILTPRTRRGLDPGLGFTDMKKRRMHAVIFFEFLYKE